MSYDLCDAVTLSYAASLALLKKIATYSGRNGGKQNVSGANGLKLITGLARMESATKKRTEMKVPPREAQILLILLIEKLLLEA